MIKLYNTLSREKDDLPDPKEQKKIWLFVCGPTVYDYLHIGNARTYIFFDFFAKYLRSQGYDVDYLQNITDIDDKIIKRAAEENKEPTAVAKFFTEAYFEDMKALGVDGVSKYARATDFISQIIAQVERLIDKDFAYKIDDDGWYFDIAKDDDYGKLSGRTVEQAEDGVSRIDEAIGKKNKGDFCLWKFSKSGEPSWPSTLGTGRPGWHIEDTAISEFYFGPQYEIHGGGVDLKFPHHEAEIAQQESASGLKPFVQIWMHTGALLADGKKMSKSLGNFITIRDFLEKCPVEVFRYFIFSAHYRTQLNFTWESLEGAKNGMENLYGMINDYYQQTESDGYDEKKLKGGIPKKTLEEYERSFNEAMNDDLNTPQALATLHEMLKDYGNSLKKLEIIRKFENILDLGLTDRPMQYSIENDKKIVEKIQKYKELRSNEQFVQSDALRKEIEALGYSVRDTENGPYVAKKFF